MIRFRVTDQYFDHEVSHGERWDTIAVTYFNDASLAHVVIEANRHLFLADLKPIPPILPAGLVIRIPVLENEGLDDSLLPPWKRSS